MSIPPLETIGDVVPATGAELASESTDSNGGLVSQTENSAGVAEEPGSHKSVGQKNVVEVSQRDVETGKGKTYGIITIPDGVSAGDALRVEFECDESLRDSPADVHRLLIKLPEGIECGKQLEVTECIVLTADVGPSRLSNDKIALYATHYLQENTMSIIAIILAFLDLGENVFTTFQFSSDFSFGAVLTTFLVIDIIKAEARAFSHCCLKSTMIPLLLLLTLVEAVQAVAYMYFCKFSNASVIYFIVFAVVQVLLMFPEEVDGVKSYLRYREKMEHIISTTMNDEEAETARMNEFVGNCCSRPLSVGMIVVLSGLSYSYTASDSPFQSLWFQVLLTIYVWYISVGYDWILSVYYQVCSSNFPFYFRDIICLSVYRLRPVRNPCIRQQSHMQCCNKNFPRVYSSSSFTVSCSSPSVSTTTKQPIWSMTTCFAFLQLSAEASFSVSFVFCCATCPLFLKGAP